MDLKIFSQFKPTGIISSTPEWNDLKSTVSLSIKSLSALYSLVEFASKTNVCSLPVKNHSKDFRDLNWSFLITYSSEIKYLVYKLLESWSRLRNISLFSGDKIKFTLLETWVFPVYIPHCNEAVFSKSCYKHHIGTL